MVSIRKNTSRLSSDDVTPGSGSPAASLASASKRQEGFAPPERAGVTQVGRGSLPASGAVSPSRERISARLPGGKGATMPNGDPPNLMLWGDDEG